MATQAYGHGRGRDGDHDHRGGGGGATRLLDRISWGAIFGGVVIAIAVQLLLSLLGVGFGLSMVDTAQNATPGASSFGIGAGVWWTVSYILSLVAGGYVAARLSGVFHPQDGTLHGLLTWAVALLISLLLLGSVVSGVVGGAFRTLSSATSSVGSSVSGVVPDIAQTAGVTPGRIRQEAEQLLSAQPTNTDPRQMSREQALQEVVSNLPTLATGDPAAQRQARDRVVQIMTAQSGITPQEANQRLDQLQSRATQEASQASATAQGAADQASSGGATAAFGACAALVLGAIAAALGGRLGTRRSDAVVV